MYWKLTFPQLLATIFPHHKSGVIHDRSINLTCKRATIQHTWPVTTTTTTRLNHHTRTLFRYK